MATKIFLFDGLYFEKTFLKIHLLLRKKESLFIQRNKYTLKAYCYFKISRATFVTENVVFSCCRMIHISQSALIFSSFNKLAILIHILMGFYPVVGKWASTSKHSNCLYLASTFSVCVGKFDVENRPFKLPQLGNFNGPKPDMASSTGPTEYVEHC